MNAKTGDRVRITTDSFPALLPKGTVTVVSGVGEANYAAIRQYHVQVGAVRLALYSDEIEVIP